MKKILFLGAAKFQCPGIIYANKVGYDTVTLDNIPENPGHKISTRSYTDISTTDKPKVLQVAKKESISAVVSFGSDVAVGTQSYLCEKLTLSGLSEKTANILTNKKTFREFLENNNLQRKIIHKSFNESSIDKVRSSLNFDKEYIIKPVDSSGSKGVYHVSSAAEFIKLAEKTLSFSMSGEAIVEEFIQKNGNQICGDGYFVDGKIVYICFGDGLFYSADISLAPYAEVFPSSHSHKDLMLLREKLERILVKSGFEIGVFNFDAIFDLKGDPFIIEVGPRPGGNFIPVAIKHHSGVDMSMLAVESALGNKVEVEENTNDVILSYMIHRLGNKSVDLEKIKRICGDNLLEINIYNNNNEPTRFGNARDVLGNLILKFETRRAVDDFIRKMNKEVVL